MNGPFRGERKTRRRHLQILAILALLVVSVRFSESEVPKRLADLHGRNVRVNLSRMGVRAEGILACVGRHFIKLQPYGESNMSLNSTYIRIDAIAAATRLPANDGPEEIADTSPTACAADSLRAIMVVMRARADAYHLLLSSGLRLDSSRIQNYQETAGNVSVRYKKSGRQLQARLLTFSESDVSLLETDLPSK